MAVVPSVALRTGAAEVANFATVPPEAHTGGFSEPTCHACHFDEPVNAEGGRLQIDGPPAEYTGGERYRLVVRLARPRMERAGFQLAARYAEGAEKGEQAGKLRLIDDRVSITESAAGVLYASHSFVGSWPTAEEDTEWILEWTAPPASAPVLFHVAGNAGNGDDSPFGDFIYVDSVRSEPQRPDR